MSRKWKRGKRVCSSVDIPFIWSFLCHSWAADPAHRERRRRRAMPSPGKAPPSLSSLGRSWKARAPTTFHLTLHQLSWTCANGPSKRKWKEMFVTTQETSFLAPSTTPYLCMLRNSKFHCHVCVSSIVSGTRPREPVGVLTNRGLEVTISGPRAHATS